MAQRKFITLTVTKIEFDMIISALFTESNYYDDPKYKELAEEFIESAK